MALSDEDIREILRLIDESDVDELRIETPEFKLHVRRGGAPAAEETPRRRRRRRRSWRRARTERSDGAVTIDAPMLGTFYAAQESPGAEPFVKVGRASSRTPSCA